MPVGVLQVELSCWRRCQWNCGRPFILRIEASDKQIGAVLLHLKDVDDDELHPVSYLPRMCDVHQARYATSVSHWCGWFKSIGSYYTGRVCGEDGPSTMDVEEVDGEE